MARAENLIAAGLVRKVRSAGAPPDIGAIDSGFGNNSHDNFEYAAVARIFYGNALHKIGSWDAHGTVACGGCAKDLGLVKNCEHAGKDDAAGGPVHGGL